MKKKSIALATIVLLAVVGVFIFNTLKLGSLESTYTPISTSSPTPVTTNITTSPVPTIELLTYTVPASNREKSFTFQYPDDWSIEDKGELHVSKGNSKIQISRNSLDAMKCIFDDMDFHGYDVELDLRSKRFDSIQIENTDMRYVEKEVYPETVLFLLCSYSKDLGTYLDQTKYGSIWLEAESDSKEESLAQILTILKSFKQSE